MSLTTIYLIRHARSDHSVREDAVRPLNPEGRAAAARLTEAMSGLHLDAVYSSPYRRTVDTVRGLADRRGLSLRLADDLRERTVGCRQEDFLGFARKQWADFDYRLEGGECLREVQERNLAALARILREHPGEAVAVGTHGTALGTLIHHYNPGFGWEGFCRIMDRMPYVLRMEFAEEAFRAMDEMDEWVIPPAP